jgi:hypothetical protein
MFDEKKISQQNIRTYRPNIFIPLQILTDFPNLNGIMIQETNLHKITESLLGDAAFKVIQIFT